MNKKLCFGLAALLFSTTLTACNEIRNAEPDRVSLRESRPVGNTKELSVDIEYDIGKLEVTKAPASDLFSVEFDYDRERYEPEIDFTEGEKATLRFSIDEKLSGLLNGNRDNDLVVRLNENIPLDLEISTGVADGHLDLTGLEIRNLRLEGGVGRTEVAFDSALAKPVSSITVESGVGELIIRGLGNTRVQRLEVEGGVGRTELDYTGEIGDAQIESTIMVGVGQIRLLLPRNADIEIQGDENFLSNINAPSSFSRQGQTYTHDGPDSVNPKIRIRVESGVGGVMVELI